MGELKWCYMQRCILQIKTISKHFSLWENQNIYWEKSKKKYWNNPLCFHRNEAMKRMLIVKNIVILENLYPCCHELGPFKLASLHSQMANSTSFLHWNYLNSINEYPRNFICEFSMDEWINFFWWIWKKIHGWKIKLWWN